MPQDKQAKTPKKPIKTSTTIMIVGGIALTIFFILPSVSPKATQAPVTEKVVVAADPVVTKVVLEAPPITTSPEPSVETLQGAYECDPTSAQYQAVSQQLVIINQQMEALEKSVEILKNMIELHKILGESSLETK